jgi:hypothetical protein
MIPKNHFKIAFSPGKLVMEGLDESTFRGDGFWRIAISTPHRSGKICGAGPYN